VWLLVDAYGSSQTDTTFMSNEPDLIFVLHSYTVTISDSFSCDYIIGIIGSLVAVWCFKVEYILWPRLGV
jgi:hypothetical protein